MQNTSWILIADSNRARIYSTLSEGIIKNEHVENTMHLIQELDHHDSHKKLHAVISDKTNSGTFVAGSDPKEAKAAQFAQNIATYLEKNRLTHKYEKLVFVAPPHFLGLLNQHISKEVEKLIKTSIAKDYTSEDEKFISQHLKEHI